MFERLSQSVEVKCCIVVFDKEKNNIKSRNAQKSVSSHFPLKKILPKTCHLVAKFISTPFNAFQCLSMPYLAKYKRALREPARQKA